MPLRPAFPPARALVAVLAALLCLSACSHVSWGPSPAAGGPGAGRVTAGPIPADGVESDTSKPTLLDTPARIRSYADHIDLSGVFPDDPGRRRLTVLLAVPPGDVTLEVLGGVVENPRTHTRVDLQTSATLATELKQPELLKPIFRAEPLGTMRRVNLCRVTLDASSGVPLSAGPVRWVEYSLRLHFPRWRPAALHDSAMEDPQSPYLRTIREAVANPEMVLAFAQPSPPAATERRASGQPWRPRPELSQGFAWRRIMIDRDGFYAIDGRWLEESGADAHLRASELGVWRDGHEVECIAAGPPGATFAEGARLLFYGRHNESPETNCHAYFLGGHRGGDRPAFEFAEDGDKETTTVLSCRRVLRVEQDNELQTRVGSFLSIREMSWVWKRLSEDQPAEFEFEAPGLLQDVPSATGVVHMYYGGLSLPPRVNLEVTLNGERCAAAVLAGARQKIEFPIRAGLLRRRGNALTLRYSVAQQAPGGSSVPPIFFDALDVAYDSLVEAEEGGRLVDFQPAGLPAVSGRLQALGFRPHRLLAMDVSDPVRPRRLKVEEAVGVAWVHGPLFGERKILLLEDDTVPRAPTGTPLSGVDWSGDEHSADAVVVYHPLFRGQAERLAAAMRTDGRECLAVNVEELYDTYSNGEMNPSAIADFLHEAVTTWKGRRPIFATLIGDCTSDGQRVSRNRVINLLPTHHFLKKDGTQGDEYACDEYYSWLLGEDELPDLFVGRLSVNNVQDANMVVDKSIRWRSQRPEPWTSRYVSVADLGEFRENATKVVGDSVAPWLETRFIATEDYPWEDNFYLPRQAIQGDEIKVSPTVTRLIQGALEEGSGVISFFGHGSPNLWSNQRIWFGGDSENSDNLRLANTGKPAFVATFTCNSGAIDYPVPRWNICISEDMMRVPGGAIACFSPSGPGFTGQHVHLAEGFFNAVSRINERCFGALAALSRLTYQARIRPDDHSRMFILLGDPSLNLAVPATHPLLTCDPPVFAVGEEPFQGVIRVHDDGLTSGTVSLFRQDGELVTTATLRSAEGGLVAPVSAALDGSTEELRAVAQVWTRSHEYLQSGCLIQRSPPRVTIQSVRIEPAQGSDGRRVGFTVANDSSSPADGVLEVCLDGDTTVTAVQRFEFHVAAHGTASLRPLIKAAPGAHVMASTIAGAEVRDCPPELPSSRSVDCLVVPLPGEAETDLTVPKGGYRLLPARTMNSTPLLEVFVANQGGHAAPAVVEYRVQYPKGKKEQGRRSLGIIEAGNCARAIIPMNMEPEMTADLIVEVSGTTEGLGVREPNRDNNSLSFVVTPSGLPDLALVPGTLRVSPDHLTEGVTIFVDADIENRGNGTSPPCLVALFADRDAAFRSPLRSLAGDSDLRIPPLAAGERLHLRLRWDPRDNLETRAIQLALDPQKGILETNRVNNLVRIPLRIFKKWQLVCLGIAARKDTPGFVTLVAKVGNTGETDAHNVSVAFYSDEKQTTASHLGTVEIARLPAGTNATIDFPWDVRKVDPSLKPKPSFQVFLKGSLQRISSAGDK